MCTTSHITATTKHTVYFLVIYHIQCVGKSSPRARAFITSHFKIRLRNCEHYQVTVDLWCESSLIITMSHNGSSETSSFIDECWASWFCNLSGNHFFCEIDKAYMEDSFNLFGLKQHVLKDYSKALDTILDRLGTKIKGSFRLQQLKRLSRSHLRKAQTMIV